MEVGHTLYVKTRSQWRRWLARNHDQAPEIWLVHYRKGTGNPSLDYNHAVEEALCFGWIDSILKKLDDDRYAQRYSPRRPKSKLSEANRVRIQRLIAEGKMTEAGLAKVKDRFEEPFRIAPDILKALKEDKAIWKTFQAFPESYQQVRIGWIETARNRSDEFQKRLDYLLKMTAEGKQFGRVQ